MMQQLKDGGRKEFPLVVKGDVQGSVEAIVGALDKLGTDEVEARIIHSGVGGITESDVALATASGAVDHRLQRPRQCAGPRRRRAQRRRDPLLQHHLRSGRRREEAMSGLLAPTLRETFLGNAEILEVFNISKVGKVAGCRVTEGKVERGAKVRLIRDNVVIHEGTLSTLKRFKDEVSEVPCRPGMRHGLRELPGHARRRHHRVLPRRRGERTSVNGAKPAPVCRVAS